MNYRNKNQNNDISDVMVQIFGLPFLVPKITDLIKYPGYNSLIVPQKIKNRWIIGKKIGQGGFGTVYECFDLNNPYNKLVIKLEHYNSQYISREIEFYKYVNKFRDIFDMEIIPRKYSHGICQGIKYIITEKLYKFNFKKKYFKEVIQGLENFSKINISHGDIKICNLMRRKNKKLVFIDFGLWYKISYEINENISGTLPYMSINSHYGIISPQNDIESFMFSFLEIIHPLPWCKEDLNNIDQTIWLKKKFIWKLKNQDYEIMCKYRLYDDPLIYSIFMEIVNNIQLELE